MLFGVFEGLFTIVFCLVVGMFIYIFAKGISQWNKNNASPTLSVMAEAVSKRINVSGDHAHTWYYITFQVESGDRMELNVSGEQYGTIIEGDSGMLTFQGTRFKAFEREI